ncbi:MAG: effector binding domain-containing protein [Kurthia sp.]|nr:effector binding domain-containing protein [Candidatus Kurthia equi]
MQTRVQEVKDFVISGLKIQESKTDDISEHWEELAEVLEDYDVQHDVLYGVLVDLTEDGIHYLAGIKDEYMPKEVSSESVAIAAGRYLVGELQSINDIEKAFQELGSNQEYTHRPGISFEKYKGKDLANIEVWVPIE